MKLANSVTTAIVVLLAISSFSLMNSGSTHSSFSDHASSEAASGTVWLFNGSFAHYTGLSNGVNATFDYSISDVNLSAGTYYVSTIVNGLNESFISYTNGSSIFPGANATSLSYFNSGKVPPWVNRTTVKQFSVYTKKITTTKIGSYSSDEIKYCAVYNIDGVPAYVNSTYFYDSYSGLILKGNVSLHRLQSWENESLELFSTNVQLGSELTVIAPNYTLYYIVGAVIAVAIVIGVGIYASRRRH